MENWIFQCSSISKSWLCGTFYFSLFEIYSAFSCERDWLFLFQSSFYWFRVLFRTDCWINELTALFFLVQNTVFLKISEKFAMKISTTEPTSFQFCNLKKSIVASFWHAIIPKLLISADSHAMCFESAKNWFIFHHPFESVSNCCLEFKTL